jgi:acetylornithine/N-succinyldiaminopimelate aminotransferase
MPVSAIPARSLKHQQNPYCLQRNLMAENVFFFAPEVLQFIQDNDLIRKAEQKGSIFFNQLEALVDNKIIFGVRGRGLMFAIDEIYHDLIDKGYIVGNRGTTFRIDPPLILSENEFERFTDTFKAIIDSHKSM